MTQGVLPFKYEQEKNNTGMTSLAGLPAYLDLSQAIGLWNSIKKNLQARKQSQGWTDTQMVMSFILLNLAGGDCVDDLDVVDIEMDRLKYKLFGTVTNMDWDGEELIHWQRKRCGKSEEVHSVMKEDLAGGKFPSEDFGENAAWWWMMILALNLNQAMKRLVLGKKWVSKRLKAIRFSLINLPGRVIERSRGLIVRLSKNHPGFDWLIDIRSRIAGLVPEPSG